MSDPKYIGWLVAEAYAAHWIFTQAGYAAADIFIGVTNVFASIDPPGPCVVVQLRHDGREMTLPIGRVEGDQHTAFHERMKTFLERDVHDLPADALARIVSQSEQYKRLPEILNTMLTKGWTVRTQQQRAREN